MYIFYGMASIISLSESAIQDLSLGAAAFRSLLWTVLFGIMVWIEFKRRPRELSRPKRWYYSERFHQIVLMSLSVAFIINAVLTFALIFALFST